MKSSSTIILRATIVIIGLIVLGICLFALPQFIMSEIEGDFDYGPIFIGLYITAIPFFYALFQALALLRFIENNKAFSNLSVQALDRIKYCAFIISAMFALAQPYVFYIADRDDAPGLAALGFVVVGASFVIGTFAAVAQKLFQNAVAIKSENDLTV